MPEVNSNVEYELLLGPPEPPSACKQTLSSVITAIGNYSIQYNFQAIAIALIIMNSIECSSTETECEEGMQAVWVASAVTGSVFIGAITGQITMGYLGDVWGRNPTLKFTLAIAAFSAAMSSILPQGNADMVYSIIIVCRFFLGVGLGGVYPISSAKAAEDAERSGLSERQQQKAGVKAFFWQTPGSITPWAVAYFCASRGDVTHALLWRLLLGLGAIPAFLVVVLSTIEMNMEGGRESFAASPVKKNGANTSLVNPSKDSARDLENIMSSTGVHSPIPHETPRPSRLSLMSTCKPTKFEEASVYDLLKRRSTWGCLMATGMTWFIFDFCYYGVNLFGGEILKKVNDMPDDVPVASYYSIQHTASLEIIALAMGFPGVIVTIIAQEFFTTKQIQVTGFLCCACLFVVMAVVLFLGLNTNTLFVVYCGLLFSLNFGANVTTFILSAETYPKRCRSTFTGISSAMGKMGAFSGSFLFKIVADKFGFPTVLMTCCTIELIGALLSYIFVGPMDESGFGDEGDDAGAGDFKNLLKDDPEVQREHMMQLREESKENYYASPATDAQ
jgi:PHS family inorganic phosphate transporter-like MFS transporter